MILLMLTYMLNLEEPPPLHPHSKHYQSTQIHSLGYRCIKLCHPRSAHDGPMDDGLDFPNAA